ncbi:MAG: WhiB family transcriptional regulator [Brevibacterium aurantiacum]
MTSPRHSDDWAGAVCAQVGSVEAERMFFPTGPHQGDRGVAMCFTCALREPCLDLALREETGQAPYGRFGIHAGHASPPCQAFSKTKTLHDNEHPDLIEPTREVLNETGLPWVIENVVGAPLVNPIRLSGQHFGMVADDVDGVPLKLVRHRLFESNIFLAPPQEFHTNKNMQTASVYGAGGGWTPRHRDNPERRGGYIPHINVIKELLGIDWMTKRELSQSIPPKFAEWVGGQLMDHLIRRAQDQTRKEA